MKTNALVLLVLVTAQRFFSGPTFPELRFLTYAAVFAVGTFAIVDAFRPTRHLGIALWVATGILILTSVVIPTIGLIQLRHVHGSVDGLVHDDPIQIEATSVFLLHGKNPYVEDYTHTDLVAWSTNFPDGIVNPAIYHVIALPGHLLLALLLYIPIHGWSGFYDERILYLLAYLVTVFLATRLGRTSVERLRSVILITLNPLLIPYIMLGRNDILLFVFLLGALLLLERRRTTAAFAVLALACTIKLFGWVFLPFFLALALGRTHAQSLVKKIKELKRPLLAFAVIVTLIIGPFILWNANAFYDDIVRYTNGTSPTSYPMNGIGFSMMLVNSGFIRHPTDSYPFWILQLITVLPLLIFTLPRLMRQPRLSLLTFSATFTLFTASFFSRFMNDNYAVLIMLLATIGYAFYLIEQHGQAPT